MNGKLISRSRLATRRVVGSIALVAAPTIIFTADARRRLEINFLPGILAHIADPHVARQPVEAEFPGIAQADSPNFIERRRIVHKRIGGRYRIRATAVDIYAHHLAEVRLSVLAVVLWVAARTAVTEAEVQVAVGAEVEVAGIVVGIGLIDAQDHQFAVGVGHIGIGRADAEPGDARMAGAVGVIDVEVAVLGVVGMKNQAQQAALIGGGVDAALDVQKRGRQALALRIEDVDDAALFGNKEAFVSGGSNIHRAREAGSESLQLNNRLCNSHLHR